LPTYYKVSQFSIASGVAGTLGSIPHRAPAAGAGTGDGATTARSGKSDLSGGTGLTGFTNTSGKGGAAGAGVDDLLALQKKYRKEAAKMQAMSHKQREVAVAQKVGGMRRRRMVLVV